MKQSKQKNQPVEQPKTLPTSLFDEGYKVVYFNPLSNSSSNINGIRESYQELFNNLLNDGYEFKTVIDNVFFVFIRSH